MPSITNFGMFSMRLNMNNATKSGAVFLNRMPMLESEAWAEQGRLEQRQRIRHHDEGDGGGGGHGVARDRGVARQGERDREHRQGGDRANGLRYASEVKLVHLLQAPFVNIRQTVDHLVNKTPMEMENISAPYPRTMQ